MAHNDNTQGLAQVYAAALYDVAAQGGITVQVQEEMRALERILQADERVFRFLEMPTIPFADKRKVLEAVLAEFSAPVRNTILLLIKRQRLELLDKLVHEFHDHCNQEAGIAEYDVVSARPLEESERASLRAALEARCGRRVALMEATDPKLLGGLVLKREDTQWDASLSRRLRSLVGRMEMVKSSMGLWSE